MRTMDQIRRDAFRNTADQIDHLNLPPDVKEKIAEAVARYRHDGINGSGDGSYVAAEALRLAAAEAAAIYDGWRKEGYVSDP